MFNINYKSQQPYYEQIVEQTLMYLMEGVLKQGDQLPSVREMALNLGVNPNTVSKAYSEMERKGYIKTVVGKGTYVSSEMEIMTELQKNYKESVRQIFDEMKRIGFTTEVISQMVRSILKEKEYVTN